ncbi:hypothetical protein [Streptosporangium sp. H16]
MECGVKLSDGVEVRVRPLTSIDREAVRDLRRSRALFNSHV